MAPHLLIINSERLFQVLIVVIVLSFFVERALALVFENRWVVAGISGRGLKEPLAFVACLVVCREWQFDALSSLFGKSNNWWGYAVTAAITAGGSKASIALFQNALGALSSAEAKRKRPDSASKRPARSTHSDDKGGGKGSAADAVG